MIGHDEALARAALRLRCTACGAAGLEPSDGDLACRGCGRRFRERNGWFDMLRAEPERPSLGQRFFFNAFGARAYAGLREGLPGELLCGVSFHEEVAWLVESLEIEDEAIVLDVPCGQGNFTAALAKARPRGVVVGVDLSSTQLALAAERLRADRLSNALLMRGNALDLPVADGGADAVSAPGGLHLYPDVPAAIGEMRRVLAPARRAAGLTFLAHDASAAWRLGDHVVRGIFGVQSFDFEELGEQFARGGFCDYRWHGRRLVAWFSARAAGDARARPR
jgi:SAM-dependent methyltransferase